MTTLYGGDSGGAALYANLPIHSSYFSDPEPATAGIALTALANDRMRAPQLWAGAGIALLQRDAGAT